MKYIHTLLFALALSFTINAQDSGGEKNTDNRRSDRQEKMENRIESQKVAFITQELDLSPKEAQMFWPIYNEYQSKMKESRIQKKSDWKQDDINDKEADAFLNNLLENEQKELDIKKEYFNKLKTAVPSKKVARLYVIEKKFREKILAKIRTKMDRKKRKGRMGGS